ncbi:MAG TPA: hypothetical protein VEG08_12035 [Terriglobales bacterium]|nr:hypothetical protein [Terriglobales bacterium]
MPTAKKSILWTIVLVVLVLLAVSVAASAQGREMYQATALGQGTQMGQLYSVNIIIESYSTEEDRQVLIEAFTQGKNDGLVNAISKMPSKGRIAITGTLGYDIKYVRAFATPTGKKIRIATDRPLRFGELWRDNRSTDYSLSVIELDISDVKGQSGGVLIPAAKLLISKEGELTIEAYQNPWKLTNVMAR